MSPTHPDYSTRLLRKGALIEETFRAFAYWNLPRSVAENLHAIRERNAIGAPNESWLREVITTLSRRYGQGDSLAPLVILARGQYPIERWRYCLLWHFASSVDAVIVVTAVFGLIAFARTVKRFEAHHLRVDDSLAAAVHAVLPAGRLAEAATIIESWRLGGLATAG